jgi:hypothetical protein
MTGVLTRRGLRNRQTQRERGPVMQKQRLYCSTSGKLGIAHYCPWCKRKKGPPLRGFGESVALLAPDSWFLASRTLNKQISVV